MIWQKLYERCLLIKDQNIYLQFLRLLIMHMPIFFAYGLHEDHDTSMEGVQMLVYVVQISRNEVKKPPTF